MNLCKRMLVLLLTLTLATAPVLASAACPDGCGCDLNDVSEPWNGKSDTSWYNAAASTLTITTAEQLAGISKMSYDGKTFQGQTIKLGADIDMNGKTFLPILLFQGIFDGDGHTIRNLNMDMSMHEGAARYLGLFRQIDNAVVRNLNIDKMSIQTCCGDIYNHYICEKAFVAGMATGDCLIENVRITNSFAETYNNSVAGVVSELIGGGKLTLRKVHVDASNTLSALWDTHDGRVAGLVAYVEPNTKLLFDSCISSPVLDVYNDVQGNYQYYLYRISGMLIGQVVDPATADIQAKNTTVAFGDWNQYRYCEFEELGQGSYNDPDEWKYIRTDSGSDLLKPGHTHREYEDHELLLPFTSLIGYGTGIEPLYEMPGVTIKDKPYYYVEVENGAGSGLYPENSTVTVTWKGCNSCDFAGWTVLDGDKAQVLSPKATSTKVKVTGTIRLCGSCMPREVGAIAPNMNDAIANLPKTGDSSSMMLWCLLLISSAAGMTLLAQPRRKAR